MKLTNLHKKIEMRLLRQVLAGGFVEEPGGALIRAVTSHLLTGNDMMMILSASSSLGKLRMNY